MPRDRVRTYPGTDEGIQQCVTFLPPRKGSEKRLRGGLPGELLRKKSEEKQGIERPEVRKVFFFSQEGIQGDPEPGRGDGSAELSNCHPVNEKGARRKGKKAKCTNRGRERSKTTGKAWKKKKSSTI